MAAARLSEAYPASKLMFMFYHRRDDGLSTTDSDVRMNFYGVEATVPRGIVNGRIKTQNELSHTLAEGETGIDTAYNYLDTKIKSELSRTANARPFNVQFVKLVQSP